MNYRHAYHAGNFADVFKHILLVRIVAHLLGKETPFRVIDTHAGIGLYDLGGDEATRTQEWRSGVGRMDAPFSPEVEALIGPYRAVLRSVRERHGDSVYPGSPGILREMLRRQDQGVFVELHPADSSTLAERYKRTANVKVLALDGWVALQSLIPPKENRGLVLIDPPFEIPGEMDRMVKAITRAVGKWRNGIFAGWYPIKDPAAVDAAFQGLTGLRRPALRLELYVERPDDPDRLSGCGMLIVNPPWTLEREAQAILSALAERLAREDYGAFRCEALPAD